MSNKILKTLRTENLCLKCDGGIIERIVKETDNETEITIKKCSNDKCKYQYGIKEFFNDYTKK